MDERTGITNWADLQMSDLVFAFRKAKADCFFDRTSAVAAQFAAYEASLASNLASLLSELQHGRLEGVLARNPGQYRLLPKKLTRSPRAPSNHVFFSSPDRAFEHLLRSETLLPEFRLVGIFPVEMHVVSALWVNLVGHKFDAALGPTAFGSRLRRLRPARANSKDVGEYHLHAPGSFEPYFTPYKRWRDRGLNTLKKGLEAGDSLIAVSLDFKSYYHSIDPKFFVGRGFLEGVGLRLTSFELDFCNVLASGLCKWSEDARRELSIYAGEADQPDASFVGGLPIGLSATRVIANCLLARWDALVEKRLTPLYYGRYVDDVLMVLKDPGDLASASELFELLALRMPGVLSANRLQSSEWAVTLGVDYQGESQLTFQEGKQKVFFLEGRGGLDLLESIGKEIRSVSSERRLMPDLAMLEESTAARVLSASGSVTDEADTLRRADSLSVRRLGWSLQLRNAETVAHDLPPEGWVEERCRFYEFAKNHILRADRILDHADYLPRLLSLAVALEDWVEAAELLRCALNSLGQLSAASEAGHVTQVRINGQLRSAKNMFLWDSAQRAVVELAADAVIRAYRWREQKPVPLTDSAARLLRDVGFPDSESPIFQLVQLLRESDWAKVPYKDHIRRDAPSPRRPEPEESVVTVNYHLLNDLIDFLGTANAGDRRRVRSDAAGSESLLPYVFPTRPYTAREIALFAPVCITGDSDRDGGSFWERYVRAVRGVWVRSSNRLTPVQRAAVADNCWVIGTDDARPIRLGITSFHTSNETWAACAYAKGDHSPERYRRVVRMVNQCLELNPRPTHVLFPELALPERWVGTASGRLRDAGISLIAGIDYICTGNEVHSEAVLVLADDRLGYPSTVEIRQRKGLPAPGEDEELTARFGRAWNKSSDVKPVYWHSGFAFGVLVCSELQNMKFRHDFQGRVDALFTLSWNKDLDSFGALVESAALDVHAYVALVNNRMYGDSRVRAPMKAAHQRDLCRVRGGGDDYVVVVDIDVDALRAFQSRATRWPKDSDRFKPVPEGFKVSPPRRTRPST